MLKKKSESGGGNLLFGRYRVTGTAATAGFGTQWQGYDVVREAPVSIATLKKERKPVGKVRAIYTAQHIRADASAVMKISHPNVLELYDLLEDDEQYYAISDFTDFTPLNRNPAVLPRGGVGMLVDTLLSIINVFQYLGRSGMVGCGIRAANVYVSSTGELKVDNALAARFALMAAFPDVGSVAVRLLGGNFGAFAENETNAALDVAFVGEILATLLSLTHHKRGEPDADIVGAVLPQISDMVNGLDGSAVARKYSSIDALAADVGKLSEQVNISRKEQPAVSFRAGAGKRTLLPGEVLFREGDAPSGEAFILEKGLIQISKAGTNGREHYLDVSRPGDIIGEMALIDAKPRMATAKAVEPCTLAVITEPQFKAMLEKNDAVTARIIKVLMQRLRYQAGEIARLKSLLGVNK